MASKLRFFVHGLYIFLKFKLFFFLLTTLCTIMTYDAPSMPSQNLNRKWACHAKMASKWCFFVPGLYIFFKFKICFFHNALPHHAPRCTIDAVTKSKQEVGVSRQNGIKLVFFRPWNLHLFEIKNFFEFFSFSFSYTFGPSCATIHHQCRRHN